METEIYTSKSETDRENVWRRKRTDEPAQEISCHLTNWYLQHSIEKVSFAFAFGLDVIWCQHWIAYILIEIECEKCRALNSVKVTKNRTRLAIGIGERFSKFLGDCEFVSRSVFGIESVGNTKWLTHKHTHTIGHFTIGFWVNGTL